MVDAQVVEQHHVRAAQSWHQQSCDEGVERLLWCYRFNPAVTEAVSYLFLYTSVFRYFRPESAISVTTLASGPSRSAT